MASIETATPAAEYQALTERCALVDRSARGKLALTGEDALEFLNGQVSNELLDLQPGEGRYAAFLTPKGKMLGDLRILAAGETGQTPSELLLDTERVALQALFDMIRRFKVGYRVELHKRTLERSLLSLIGPRADSAAQSALDAGELPSRTQEHAHTQARIAGVDVRLIRTDLGLDVLLESGAHDSVLAALEMAGATLVTEDTAEIVRVESGRPRYGIDIDQSVIPQEAGLNERAVSFTKGCYVGQETVARLHYRGKPNRHLRGLRLSEPVESGAELLADRRSRRSTIGGPRTVGHLGSSVISPRLGPIALALIRHEAGPGASVAVGESGARASVVELPFQ